MINNNIVIELVLFFARESFVFAKNKIIVLDCGQSKTPIPFNIIYDKLICRNGTTSNFNCE